MIRMMNVPGTFMLHPLVHFNLPSEFHSSDRHTIAWITQRLINERKYRYMHMILTKLQERGKEEVIVVLPNKHAYFNLLIMSQR